jgi:hypothetical protein
MTKWIPFSMLYPSVLCMARLHRFVRELPPELRVATEPIHDALTIWRLSITFSVLQCIRSSCLVLTQRLRDALVRPDHPSGSRNGHRSPLPEGSPTSRDTMSS